MSDQVVALIVVQIAGFMGALRGLYVDRSETRKLTAVLYYFITIGAVTAAATAGFVLGAGAAWALQSWM